MLGNTKHEKMFFQKLSEMEPNTEKKTFFRSKVFSKNLLQRIGRPQIDTMK